MNARMLVAAFVLLAMPALAQAQVSCTSCAAGRSPSVIRPCSAELWADYHHPDCGGCGHCARCCDPCCTPLICVIPNTLRKIGRTLDCLLPCGPRSGHGCGISCIGAGSGCTPGACGCPGIFHHNKCCDYGCGEVAPPMYRSGMGDMPPAPQPQQETRRAPAANPYAKSQAREITQSTVALKGTRAAQPAATQSISNEVSTAEHVAPVINKKPISVLKRVSYEEEIEATPVQTNWPKNMEVIPHNPLR